MLQSLGQRFDYFLAQASFIRSLFVAVNDEVFYVREAAIMVLGRLTQLNPAHVMPALRRMLVQVSSCIDACDTAVTDAIDTAVTDTCDTAVADAIDTAAADAPL